MHKNISVNSLCTDSVSIGLVCWGSTDLFEGPLSSEEFVEKADGDAKHGGQSQTPPNDLAPPRVNVSVVVCQRLVVHQVEQEDALQRGRNRSEPLQPGLSHISTAQIHHAGGVWEVQHKKLNKSFWETMIIKIIIRLVPEKASIIFIVFLPLSVQSYHADTRSYKGPAPLHPGKRPVANHTSYVIHKAVSTCRKSTGSGSESGDLMFIWFGLLSYLRSPGSNKVFLFSDIPRYYFETPRLFCGHLAKHNHGRGRHVSLCT